MPPLLEAIRRWKFVAANSIPRSAKKDAQASCAGQAISRR